MPKGKPAGVACVQLTATNTCALFGRPGRPQVCVALQASVVDCGDDRAAGLGDWQ